ncbi:LOG family protein [Rhodopirellula sp. MGV]|uniref:LOG family protein n=1 Tax=Rhodopirellula sp. MGV TaxID=2023130 RepID=UPI000B97027C|nr:LOG family protein [Rhodopirellula sp. MGV]OYP38406.1 cytochrome D ubiquinol oxidase subunit II [Rhodopirellula sp. MGV]PNY34175.1 LOG family protein [Rhodopirellula baltica]
MDANEFDPQELPPEAIGESEQERPQPADDPIVDTAPPEKTSLFDEMRATIDRLERDKTSRGDLKILSRTLLELRYAFKVFRPYRRRRKVTIFGSARTQPDHPDYQSAVELGRAMAGHGWMVITGAGGGIMHAGHVGAGKEASMGLNIMLPFEQGANPVIEGDSKLVTMKYFFTRKLMFVKECSAVVCCPGGFGTLDEALETLTLMQTGKQTMLPLVLLDHPEGNYWSDFGKFVDRNLGQGGMISPDDTSLYKITNDVNIAVQEILRFYRRYHSMRYVRDRLVFRLKERLTDAKLASLNENFSDILVKGKIEQTKSLPEEAGEPDLAGLPRLVLNFNRRSLGRLRKLIDEINAD